MSARFSSRQEGGARVSKSKVVISAFALAVWCVAGATTMLVARAFRLGVEESFPRRFHAGVCRLFSLDCEYSGSPVSDRPTLYVSNHVSYLDVFVLGGVLKGSFAAKAEVASWPVFGKLARLQNTLFLVRDARRATEQIEVVRNHLREAGNLIMFPEGTSTSGTDVGPFRSSLFAAADEVVIQPVTIGYVDYDGEPMTQSERDRYAWYLPNPKEQPGTPNRPFVSHFLAGMGLKRCTVRVLFHEPVTMAEAGSRKQCALHCEQSVRGGLERVLGCESGNVAAPEISSGT